jgi:hypothetical protein
MPVATSIVMDVVSCAGSGAVGLRVGTETLTQNGLASESEGRRLTCERTFAGARGNDENAPKSDKFLDTAERSVCAIIWFTA